MPEELVPAGIYKDNDTNIPDYEGCKDELIFVDEVNISDEVIYKSITSYHPEVMKDSDYKVFIPLLSKVVTQIDGYSNFVKECYNFDIYDSELIYKLSSLLDINYPFNYGFDKLGLLVENFSKISKVRGEIKAIKMLLRLLDRSESDLYISDDDDTEITIDDEGIYHITNSRIDNSEFANYMIRKIIQAGRSFIFDSDLNCKYNSFSIDTIEYKDTHEIVTYTIPENYIIKDRIYTSSSKTILEAYNDYKSTTDSAATDDTRRGVFNALLLDSNRIGFYFEYPY